MTKEHVWGEWLKPYISMQPNSHRVFYRLLRRDEADRTSLRKRAGPPLLATVPVVCGSCNSSWMNQIQTDARRHLVPMIEGRPIGLTESIQMDVATWATMAAITGEFMFERHASIGVSYTDRIRLRDTRRPLPGWRIWLGHYHRRFWEGTYGHAVMPIHGSDDIVIPNVQEPDVPLPNSQWSTVVIGRFFCHASSSDTAPDWIAEWNWENAPRARSLLVQIWPVRESFIAWPPHVMTDRDVTQFATAHFSFLQEAERSARRGRHHRAE